MIPGPTPIPPAELAAILDRAECLFTDADVDRAYDAMAAAVAEELGNRDPIAVCVMIGGLVPAVNLMSRLAGVGTLQLDYVHATRYRLGTRGQQLDWITGPRHDLSGRDVIVIDDVLDEGVTLMAIRDRLKELGAARVRTAVLVDKATPRDASVVADIVGLHAPNRYLFGCGMDYRGYFRHFRAIYAAAEQDT